MALLRIRPVVLSVSGVQNGDDHHRREALKMKKLTWWRRLQPVSAGLVLTVSLHAAAVSADSTRGAEVFELQGCGQCHALNGVGPKVAPDLGLIADRGFTPAA